MAVFSWRSASIVSFMLETSLGRRFTEEARDSDSWFSIDGAVVGASVSGAYSSRSFVTCSLVSLSWHFEHLMICPQHAVPALVKELTSQHSGIGHSMGGCTLGHSFSNKSIWSLPASIMAFGVGFSVAPLSCSACFWSLSVPDSSSSSIAYPLPIHCSSSHPRILRHCASTGSVKAHSPRLNRR